MMIPVVDQQQPERNSPKVPNIALPSHYIIWLRMMPSPHLLLSPRPPPPGQLQLALPQTELARQVNKVYLVKQVGNGLLPLITGVLEADIQIPHDY
jgi:hypothetical protein